MIDQNWPNQETPDQSENLDCHKNCKNWLLCGWPHKVYEDEMVNTPGLEWCWNKLNECNQRVLLICFFFTHVAKCYPFRRCLPYLCDAIIIISHLDISG